MTAIAVPRLEKSLILQARTAEELMVPNPISLRAEADISEAFSLFTEKGITAAPVIDEAGHPIGVISRSDLLIHQYEHEKQKGLSADFFAAPRFGSHTAFPEGKQRKTASKVFDLMTPAVFAVSPDTPVQRVVADMVGLHVHRLFVVDEDGALVGVISTMDVLKCLKTE
jgi:CBS domain-containing protein